MSITPASKAIHKPNRVLQANRKIDDFIPFSRDVDPLQIRFRAVESAFRNSQYPVIEVAKDSQAALINNSSVEGWAGGEDEKKTLCSLTLNEAAFRIWKQFMKNVVNSQDVDHWPEIKKGDPLVA